MHASVRWKRRCVLAAAALVAVVWVQGCGQKAEETAPPPEPIPADYPRLPWPPPKPTSRFLIPQGLVIGGEKRTLGDAFRVLKSECDSARLDWSVYAIDSTGLAVVSELDSIDEKGVPKWGDNGSHAGSTDWGFGNLFSGIMKKLFAAAPGRYRIIVFAVTAKPMKFAADTLSRSEATDLLMSGEAYLPESLMMYQPGATARCEALVYEYWRPSEVDTASWVPFGGSKIKPIDHLANSGLWSRKDLTR